jgi:hypothetical protein
VRTRDTVVSGRVEHSHTKQAELRLRSEWDAPSAADTHLGVLGTLPGGVGRREVGLVVPVRGADNVCGGKSAAVIAWKSISAGQGCTQGTHTLVACGVPDVGVDTIIQGVVAAFERTEGAIEGIQKVVEGRACKLQITYQISGEGTNYNSIPIERSPTWYKVTFWRLVTRAMPYCRSRLDSPLKLKPCWTS